MDHLYKEDLTGLKETVWRPTGRPFGGPVPKRPVPQRDPPGSGGGGGGEGGIGPWIKPGAIAPEDE